MASYATVPADLESEATLLNSKPKTKTSLLAWDCFTDDGADSEQNQQWVFTCPMEKDCGM